MAEPEIKQKDVKTCAIIIAEKYLKDAKIENIKEAVVAAMLEYGDLRERKCQI